jgi:NADPH-dependent curcumin reductase CurA
LGAPYCNLQLRPTFFSVDPYLRGRMTPGFSYLSAYQIGKPFDSLYVAEVVESNDPSLVVGDAVSVSAGGPRAHHTLSGNPPPFHTCAPPNNHNPPRVTVEALPLEGSESLWLHF